MTSSADKSRVKVEVLQFKRQEKKETKWLRLVEILHCLHNPLGAINRQRDEGSVSVCDVNSLSIKSSPGDIVITPRTDIT
jgi:hypothetical protein